MSQSRDSDGSVVRRMRVGRELRRLREAAGLTQTQAAEAIRGTGAKISRIESAVVGARERDVADLLTLYGATDEAQRDALLRLVRESRESGWWWHIYRDVLPSGFQVFIGLEEAATQVRGYEPHFIPGLLQTEEYVREIMATAWPAPPPDEVERRIKLRLDRQRALVRADPLRLRVLVEESALRRLIGGQEVMWSQLQHLVNMAAMPNVTIQVMPLGAPAHPVMYGAFYLFDLPDLPDIVYSENMTSSFYLDEPEDTEPYRKGFDRACAQAAPPEQSMAIVSRIQKEMSG